MNMSFGLFARQNYRGLIAVCILLVTFVAFFILHPRHLSVYTLTIWANQGTCLAFVSMSQAMVVLTAGIDLSVGPILALSNSLASEVVNGSPAHVAFGIFLVMLTGLACGFINGLVVVVGRIQPIVTTLATGTVYTGLALFIRPTTGGQISEGLSDALTSNLYGIPSSLLLVAGTILLIWVPFRRTNLGRGIYAVGSSEGAAYMSGLDVKRSKMAAYTLAGLLASFGGLFIGLQTLTGDAMTGGSYTLISIASVVLGGTSLSGGIGGALEAIIGAFTLRTINSMMFFAGAPPLAQPLFEGLILMAALSLGGLRLIGMRNRLDLWQ